MKRLIEIPINRLPAEGQRILLRHEEKSVLLLNVAGTFHAIDDSCPHSGASLFAGKLQGNMLQCPAHGLRFNLDKGCPAAKGLEVRTYPIDRQGEICIVNLSGS
ncbi:Rieske (2Fe-2S) protein [Pseudomonas izuensis]|uniref:Rieske (2Fe-2S) protein n=1 Tax=Pseudomonas izuensis TaxID=2684212 RepID=UPI001357E74C|nr:Rieske (2Fe-2S) protein [Pseudomonas izuensis]